MTLGTAPAVAPSGIGYAIRILVGTTIVWLALARIQGVNPLWAIISVVVVSEPELEDAVLAFKSRVANTLVGCAVGLSFLFVLGPAVWSILLAMVVAVVICTSFIRVPLSWKIAPITVALVMTPSVLDHSRSAGLSIALHRTAEVLFGSAVAVGVSLVGSKLQRGR
ncbi:MAG TPA: FUSC family protein [Candidatus Dormibacteraeota bacterium]|nr:FUSC family protein [Candidatus Dormibacteraeota bacterium]